ncbi:MAG: ATP-binding protein, partial [Proteobacteria bacterium]|nr:ATP-binding protein [Pseudomonadota bacterium]
LLTENYLGGEVGFSSEEGAGTTFWVKLPVREDLA